MILCAGNNEHFDFAQPIGVGLIQSAIQLTRYILEQKPSFVFFVGTAGSYGRYKPFDLVLSHSAANVELSLLQNQSYTPIQNTVHAKHHYNVSRGTNYPFETVNSSNYITMDFQLSHYFNEKNIALENMEFFSVIQVANTFDLPCLGLFVVTNYCNENAHRDFVSNHAKAKALISLHVEKNMRI
jgi:nucleoside phosphorylase